MQKQPSTVKQTDFLENRISNYVTSLRSRQSDLQSLFARKQPALVHGDIGALQRYAVEEERLTLDLVRLTNERSEILRLAASFGQNAQSVVALAEQAGLSDNLQDQLQHAKSEAIALQRDGRTLSLVAARATKHYEQLIAMIASGGSPAESYSDGHQNTESSGGNLLDAAA